jgi:endoglucanase
MKDQKGVLWDRKKLEETLKPWKELHKNGVGIYVGEFGVYNHTPHEVTLRFLNDYLDIFRQNRWGWAMWCFRGSFGVADSGRKDVRYEKFRGVLLDRTMVELLQNF